MMKSYQNMPFDGYEFGDQLIKELNLNDVRIETTAIGDHYDLEQRKVKVHGERLQRVCLTSSALFATR